MNIRLGDKVKFVDEVGGGTVVGLKNNLVTVEDEHGFQYEVPEDSVLLDQKIDYRMGGSATETDSLDNTGNSRNQNVDVDIISHLKTAKIPFLEVDLHIQHLMSDNQKLGSHDMVLMQMSHVKKMFEAARKNRYTKVVYIHGVGAGRLKNEIRTYLSKKSNCEFFDGNFQTYGYGATEVRLWYN